MNTRPGSRTKPPKLRFRPGDRFRLDGGVWEIILAYRLNREPHVWRFVLEECDNTPRQAAWVGSMMVAAGLANQDPAIVYDAVWREEDAREKIRNRYAMGSQTTKTVQDLIALPRA
jgi:hypothetical protein